MYLIVFFQLENRAEANEEWVQRVGIEAAAQLISLLPDGNHSNLVLLQRFPLDNWDSTVFTMSNITMDTVMTIRFVPIRSTFF